MKKIAILIALVIAPFLANAQNQFKSFEDDKDVSSVVITKNMFKLLSKMDLDSTDPEAKEYLQMVNDLNEIRIFTTANPSVAAKMQSSVTSYLSGSKGLSELMRVKDDGKNIKFYSREGKNENFVSELLMFMEGGKMDGKEMTIVMSITGNIDLKKISKLTEQLKVPGSEELKNIGNNKKNQK